MRRNRIYITSILLLSFLSGKAQKIEELTATSLEIGYEKTLHLIFPTEVKYYSIGGELRHWRESNELSGDYTPEGCGGELSG